MRFGIFPAGTIEVGETEEEALIREVREELGVAVFTPSITFEKRVTGPAYGRDGLVELNCFRASWDGDISAQAEISELGWFGAEDRECVAPAIRLLFDILWSTQNDALE